jgi:hypothetical protein
MQTLTALIVFKAYPNGTPTRYSTSLFVTAGLRLKRRKYGRRKKVL